MSERKKDSKVFLEMVMITIFSLVSASLWIDPIKNIVASGVVSELMMRQITAAITATLVTVCLLTIFFSDPVEPYVSEDKM
jgi:hypothetical protein